jgi:hypothetical protein
LHVETVRAALFTFAVPRSCDCGLCPGTGAQTRRPAPEPGHKTVEFGPKQKFNGGTEAPTRSASTKTFYVSEKKLTKTFVADRQAPTSTFSSRSYTTKSATVPTAPAMKGFEAKKARGVSTNAYSAKKYATRDFAGNRPFLGQGKSQKALHAQDRPLTIDEVRELLNKNK